MDHDRRVFKKESEGKVTREGIGDMASNFDEPRIVTGDYTAVGDNEEKLGGVRIPRVKTLKSRTMISDYNFTELNKGNSS